MMLTKKTKITIILILICLLSLNCSNETNEAIVLLDKALLYQTQKEEAAVSDDKLYRGEKINILKRGKKHYFIYSSRLKIKGWIKKKYILRENYKIGTVISKGKLYYADKNVLIPTNTSPPLKTRILILGQKKDWYKINYQGSQFFYIKKNHISMKYQLEHQLIHIEGLGTIEVNAPFQDLSIIGNEQSNSPLKMFDNNVKSFFLSRKFNGKEILTIKFPSKIKFQLKIINGCARSLTAYKKYGRIHKIQVKTEENSKSVTLTDQELDFQTVGLFYTREINLNITDIFPGKKHAGFAISEIHVKVIDDREYEIYNQLLTKRKLIYKLLYNTQREIKNNDFRTALEILDKVNDEIPQELTTSYIGVGVKLIAYKIYLTKLKDYQSAEKILDALLYLTSGRKNKLLYDLSRTPVSNKLAIDIKGLNTYFNEKKYKRKTEYNFPVIHLKSHIFFIAAKIYFKLNKSAQAMLYLRKILLHERKFMKLRGTANEIFYSKLALNLIKEKLPKDIALNFLKNDILPYYKTGLDEKEDENYLYYVIGQLEEYAANRENAIKFYKKCLNIPPSYNASEKPFSYTLAVRKLREIQEN